VKNGKNTPLKFTNDGMTLTVQLDKSYVKNPQLLQRVRAELQLLRVPPQEG